MSDGGIKVVSPSGKSHVVTEEQADHLVSRKGWALPDADADTATGEVVPMSAEGPDPGKQQGEGPGVLESMARSLAHGMTLGADSNMFGLGAGLAARRDQHMNRAVTDPAVMAPPDASFWNSRAAHQGEVERGEAAHVPARVAGFAGEAATSMMAPQARVAKGAGMAQRALAGLKNVGGDVATGMAAGYGMSESRDPEQMVQDAKTAGTVSGVAGAGMRGAVRLPGAVARGVAATGRGIARGRAFLGDEAVGKLAGEFLDDAPARAVGDVADGPLSTGAEARRLALEGADVDSTTRALHKDLRAMEDVKDLVMSEAKISMKPAKLAPKFEADGVTDSAQAWFDAAEMAEGVQHQMQRLLSDTSRIKNMPGSNNIVNVQKAVKGFDQATADLAPGPQGVAQVYAALDQLKREVHKAGVKIARTDRGAADMLLETGDKLRAHLLDESTWGKGATEFQRETNAAWHKVIPVFQEFNARFMSRAAKEATAGNELIDRRLVGSEDVERFVRKAGTAGNMDAEASLRAYLKEQPELLRVLSEYYEVSPGVAGQIDGVTQAAQRAGGNMDAAVSAAEQASGRVTGSLDETIKGSDATRRLSELKEAAPNVANIPLTSPASIVSTIGKVERFADKHALGAKADSASTAAGVLAKLAGIREASGGGGTAEAQASDAPTSYTSITEKVQSIAETNPAALGEYGPQMAEAIRKSPQHLSSLHSDLMQTDPNYQEMMRRMEDGEEYEASP